MFFDSKEAEWSNQQVFISGARLAKIEGIQFGITVEKAHLFAEGDNPFGIQSGNRTPAGNLKVLKGALDDMNNAAVAAGGRDITDLEFDIQVVYRAAKNRPLRTRTLIGCQFTEFKEGWDQGAKQMEIDLPFLFLDIK